MDNRLIEGIRRLQCIANAVIRVHFLRLLPPYRRSAVLHGLQQGTQVRDSNIFRDIQ